jgi:hypothetical protein
VTSPGEPESAEGLELQIRERPAAPQRLRIAQFRGSLHEIARLERRPPLRGQLLEPVQVEFSRLDPEQVTGRASPSPLALVART